MQETINEQQSTNTIKVDFQDKKLLIIIVILVCVVGLLCGIAFALLMNQRNNTNGISTQVSVSRYTISPVVTSTTTTLSTVTTQSTTTENTIQSVTTVDTTTSNTVSNDIKYLTYSDGIVSFQYPENWNLNMRTDDLYRQNFGISKGNVTINLLSGGVGCTSTTYYDPAYPDQLTSYGIDTYGKEVTQKSNSNIKIYHLNLIGNSNDTIIYDALGIGSGLMSKDNIDFPNRYYSGCNFIRLDGLQYMRYIQDLRIDHALILVTGLDSTTSIQEVVPVIEKFANSLKFENASMTINGIRYTHNEGRFIRFDYPEGADITIPKYEGISTSGMTKISNGTINSFGEISSIQISKNYGSYTQKLTLGFAGYGDGCSDVLEKNPTMSSTIIIKSVDCGIDIPDQQINIPSSSYVEKYNMKFDIYMIAGKVNASINIPASVQYGISEGKLDLTSVPMIYSQRKIDNTTGYYNSGENNSSLSDTVRGYIKDNVSNNKITQQGTKYIKLDCAIDNSLSDSEYTKRANQCFDMADTFMNSFEIK